MTFWTPKRSLEWLRAKYPRWSIATSSQEDVSVRATERWWQPAGELPPHRRPQREAFVRARTTSIAVLRADALLACFKTWTSCTWTDQKFEIVTGNDTTAFARTLSLADARRELAMLALKRIGA